MSQILKLFGSGSINRISEINTTIERSQYRRINKAYGLFSMVKVLYKNNSAGKVRTIIALTLNRIILSCK